MEKIIIKKKIFKTIIKQYNSTYFFWLFSIILIIRLYRGLSLLGEIKDKTFIFFVVVVDILYFIHWEVYFFYLVLLYFNCPIPSSCSNTALVLVTPLSLDHGKALTHQKIINSKEFVCLLFLTIAINFWKKLYAIQLHILKP